MSDEELFAVTPEYQAKVLAAMLQNTQFCDIAASTLDIELFSNKALQWFFKKLSVTDGVHLTAISLKEELKKAALKKEIKQEEVSKYVSVYSEVSTKLLPEEFTHIRNDFHTFVRTQAVKRAIIECLPLIKTQEWGSIVSKVEEAIARGTDLTNLGQDYFLDYKDRFSRRINEEIVHRIPIGVPEIDGHYLNGGLDVKQLGLIVGGTGRGKSVFLSHIAKTAVLMGYKVVYYTLELSEDVVGARFDSTFAQVPFSKLKANHEKAYEEVKALGQKFGSSLRLKEFPAKKATVSTLKAHYKLLCENGFVPDIVIVDYLDLLASDRHYNELRFELDYITQQLRGWAQEYETRVWTASQLNRGGYAIEHPDATHIAEGFAKFFTVDMALIMAQTQAEHEDEIMRIKIEKNRNGPAGYEVSITTDYGFMTFYRSILKQETGDEFDTTTDDS